MSVNKTPAILVVDDEPDNFDVIEALLNSEKYDLYYSPSGRQILHQLDHYQPDVILLDVMMPDMDGMAVCRCIKQMPIWSAVPVIMVTALTGKDDLAQCIAAGADDFISKPVSRIELQARIRSMLRIRQQYQILANFSKQLEDTVQKRTFELHQRIFQDTLTQLPSREFLLQHLGRVLDDPRHSFALATVGCDRFKLINGSLGHDIGDQLLVEIAQRLQQQTRLGDLLVRIGEDEFCFFFDNIADETETVGLVQKIIACFDIPFRVAGLEIYITACVGIALRGSAYVESQKPLQDADTAMYQAKLQGKGRYQVFDHQMHQRFIERLTLENNLRRALERQEFVNYYQPVVNLNDQAIIGFEALVRWQHPEMGIVPPGKFIPCMEETGLIVPVGMMVFRLACEQLNRWHQAGWPQLTVSINLSARQFAHPHLMEDIDCIVAETQIDPRYLRLEITESAIMEDAQAAIEVTKALRARHMQLSIDDFGTGYSSLGYLNQFPIDSLKIDRTFVMDIGIPNHKPEILHAIVGLGNSLDLKLVAEGIETSAQLSCLQALGIQAGQGYFFGKPLEAVDATALLLNRNS
ncbi:MAG: EAL domain-containing protein [Cyanobacteria bacterium P01_H01_bin.58]